MRKYELVLIINPDLNASKKKELVAKLKKMIEGGKGKIEKTDEWGKKQFSYPIKKLKEGDYLFWEVSLPEQGLGEIDRKLRLETEVLRFLLVKK